MKNVTCRAAALVAASISILTTVALVTSVSTAHGYSPQDKKPTRIERKTPPVMRPGEALRPQRIFDTTLKIVEGGGEFEFLRDEIVVLEAVTVKLQWETTKTNATSGRWEVTVAGENDVLASGVASPAPKPGHFHRVTIPVGAFLHAAPPAEDARFAITIRPYGATNTPVGATSNTVHVKQLAQENYPPPTDFGDGAFFPSVELVSVNETVTQVRLTQLFATYADAKVRVTNRLDRNSDPMLLNIKDHQLLFRQDTPVSVPELAPGQTMTYDIRLDAILPPPKSQTPQEQQQREWRQAYTDRCGPEYRSVLDWRGPQSQTPMDAHRESALAMPGWEDYMGTPPSVSVCDATQCAKLCDMEKSIRAQLDGNVVGYAYVVGGSSPKFGAGGKARTAANGAAVDFTSRTPITVASVSKWITAIAAMRILAQNGVNLTDPVGPFFPDDWNVGQYFQNVTFGQFLAQQSGIKDYGNVDLTYAKLRTFFQQPVNNAWTPSCTGSAVVDPPNAVNPTAAMQRCYSNYNFAIFRILLPAVAGLPVDDNLTTRPATLANQYEELVRDNVFERVDQDGTGCRPRGSVPHAFAYKYPGDEAGYDWGDVRLTCGGAGWYVSAEDMAKVLFSINSRDNRILTENRTTSMLDQMRTGFLGLDNWGNNNFMEKNGGWGANGTNITTTAAIFGPVTGPNVIGVLFVNSDISGGPSSGSSAKQVLINAYNAAVKPK